MNPSSSLWTTVWIKSHLQLPVVSSQVSHSSSRAEKHERLKMKSAQMCLYSIMKSHGRVMEFHTKATVGALFMFDMSGWGYFGPFSDRLPCGFLIPVCLLLLPSALSLLGFWNPVLCVCFCLSLFHSLFFPSSLSFSSALMLSVVSLGVIVLTLFHSL